MRQAIQVGIICGVALVAAAGHAQAGLISVGAFSGNVSETFEAFPTYSPSALVYLANPTSIMGGEASISNPTMLVYEPGNANAWFDIGTSGLAQVADGDKALGIDRSATTTISFASAVSEFGAYWGEATGFGFPNPNVVTVSFFDGLANLIGTETFDYSHSAAGDGGLDWHGWSSTVGIKSIQFTGDYIVIDGLQANLVSAVPEPSSLALLGMGVTGLCGYGWRRKRLQAA